MEADIELKSIKADVVVLDYTTSNIDLIDLPDDLKTDETQSEDIENYLCDTLNYHLTDICWMHCNNSGTFRFNHEKAR